MIEEWLPVVGFEGFYEVSNHGRIKSLRRVVIRSNGTPMTVPERFLRPGRSGSVGHMQVILYRGDARKIPKKIHRMVLEAFTGAAPDGLVGCHNNGDPSNNRLDNLRWDTPLENSHDVLRHGTNVNANKTHCPAGHEYDATNTQHFVARGRPARRCLTCTREGNKRRYESRKSAA